MKVLFRSDSSSQIGFGHIKRDLVLAKQYSDVSFACLPLEGSLIDEIPYPVYELSSESIYELINLIKEEKFELLIIDHYGISVDDEKLIKLETGVKILSFDDEIKPHHCDILLNVNAYAKASDYEGLVPFKCEVRCGFSYALIREEFYQEAKENREKKYDFFICMGGTDIKNLSLQIASELPKTKIISIATSSSNPNLKKLQKFAKLHNNIRLFIDHENIAKLHNNIRLFIDHENIAKLMNESNKLIISASSLVNEALLLKANFKAICYVKNQESTATWLAKKGYEVEYKY
ncbi:UDP-2,4-diacetamido-2,4,6-trideoxy-beta-L-altropyranose hydrolase [Campylobacter jejuni]|nr:UDP-2,4-diacetamido-2,4,6-trideoxy-beta-L-altropyranose hydrolase [Campylobacter jejuni]